jgi:hypothetical protein
MFQYFREDKNLSCVTVPAFVNEKGNTGRSDEEYHHEHKNKRRPDNPFHLKFSIQFRLCKNTMFFHMQDLIFIFINRKTNCQSKVCTPGQALDRYSGASPGEYNPEIPMRFAFGIPACSRQEFD